jgi:hypothetical protein
MFRLILGAVSLILVLGGGYVVVKKVKPEMVDKGIQDITNNEKLGDVLGAAQQLGDGSNETLNKVAPAFNSGVQLVAQLMSDSASEASTDGGKIDVNQFVEQTKSNVSQIPEQVFERARYEYCQQVVDQYESKQSGN